MLNLNITFVHVITDEAELCFKMMKTVKFQRDFLVLRGQYQILNDKCSSLFLLIPSSSLKKKRPKNAELGKANNIRLIPSSIFVCGVW